MHDFSIGTAAEIAARLDGVCEGRQWRCRCPLHGGHSLMVADGRKGRLLFHCFGGCEFPDIAAFMREWGVALSYHGPEEIESTADLDRATRRLKQAAGIYDRAEPVEGTLAESYLRSRGITIPIPSALRFLQYAPHRNRRSYPALVAPVRDVMGNGTGVHLTYLDPSGHGKYPFQDKTKQRECYGLIRGGVVSLEVEHPDRPLVVSEGVETALSCMQLFKLPAWAALSASGLATLELPPEVQNIAIAVDHDENGAGQDAASSARYRWEGEGRKVRRLMPPDPGTDFNDVLLRRGTGNG
jgi:putative DNA primase/helicase